MKLMLRETSGPLPTSHFEFINDQGLVTGKLQLRHTPSKSSDFPIGFENHVYYEIGPEFRNKGYGKQLLALGLEKAREIGLKEVILTCFGGNIFSQKIIESNGGILIDAQREKGGEMVRKYRIIF